MQLHVRQSFPDGHIKTQGSPLFWQIWIKVKR